MRPTRAAALKRAKRRLLDHITSQIPGFSIRYKSESRFFKWLASVAFWNRGLLDRYITTLYPSVYVPSSRWARNRPAVYVSVMSHEYMHLRDRQRLGIFFNLLYLSPQIFALLALLAPLNLWFALFLLCMAPLPSPGRAWLEYRGYRANMAVDYWVSGYTPRFEWVLSQFTGSAYYWMFPFSTYLLRCLRNDFEKIQKGDLNSELKELQLVLSL